MMDMQRAGAFDTGAGSGVTADYTGEIGRVVDISGSGSQVRFSSAALARQVGAPDPSLASGGQVGSQIKVKLGGRWLIANIRELKLSPTDPEIILAAIDFLGEGDEERLGGRMINFRRGVTRYPLPGAHSTMPPCISVAP